METDPYACTHIYIYIQAHMYIQIHTYIHMYTCTYIYTKHIPTHMRSDYQFFSNFSFLTHLFLLGSKLDHEVILFFSI